MFPTIEPQTPTTIRRLTIVLIQYDGLIESDGTQAAEYTVTVEDQNGNIMHFPADHGNLIPLLTPEEIQGASTWLNNQFQKAIDGFIPG